MATDSLDIPEGFVLDNSQESDLPNGFILDNSKSEDLPPGFVLNSLEESFSPPPVDSFEKPEINTWDYARNAIYAAVRGAEEVPLGFAEVPAVVDKAKSKLIKAGADALDYVSGDNLKVVTDYARYLEKAFDESSEFISRGVSKTREDVKDYFPGDERLQDSLLAEKVPSAVGQIAASLLVPLGKIKDAAYAVAGLSGSLQGLSSGYSEARQAGASDSKALVSGLLNAGVSISEAIPLGAWMMQLGGKADDVVKTILSRSVDVSVKTFEEGAQEFFQTTAGNAIAKNLYDENRGWFDNSVESGEVGGIAGFLTSLVISAATGKKVGRTARTQEDKVVKELSEAVGPATAEAAVENLGNPPKLTSDEQQRINALREKQNPTPRFEGVDENGRPIQVNDTVAQDLNPFEKEQLAALEEKENAYYDDKKSANQAEAPVESKSDRDKKIQDLTDQRNKLIIEVLPTKVKGSNGEASVEEQISEIDSQIRELTSNTQQEMNDALTGQSSDPQAAPNETQQPEIGTTTDVGADEGGESETSPQESVVPVSQSDPVGIQLPVSASMGPGAGSATDPYFTPTSIKNETVGAELTSQGLVPPEQTIFTSQQIATDAANEIIKSDVGAQDALIKDLEKNPRAANPVENALLLNRWNTLRNDYASTIEESRKAMQSGDPEAIRNVKIKMDRQSQERLTLAEVLKTSGTIAGQSLQSRKNMINADFSLAAMETEARMDVGGRELTPQENQEVQRLHEKIKSTQEAFDAYKAQAEQKQSDAQADAAVKELNEKITLEVTPQVKSLAERIVASLEKEADAARLRLRSKFATTSAGVDPTILLDLSIIGSSHIARGSLDFVSWSKAMLADIGEGIRPYLDQVFILSNDSLDDRIKKSAGGNSEKVKKAVKSTDVKEQRAEIIKGIKKASKDTPLNELGRYVSKLAENFVRDGIKDRDALVTAVHEELKTVLPDITRRQAMDAISGYGEFKPLNPDAIKTEVRDIKGQLQNVAKLEDLLARKPLAKTGIERREPSNEERRLVKLVNDYKKRFGVVVTDAATQLKSSLDGIKTRLKNQIADLDFQISTGKKTVNKPSGVAYDEEATALKAQRDALKEKFDQTFGKTEMTDEQRVKAAISSVEKSIADLEQRIKTNDIGPKSRKSKTPNTPELEAARSKRDALKEDLQELRDIANPKKTDEQRKEESLLKSIKDLEAQIATGNMDGKPKTHTVDTRAVADLKAQRENLVNKKREILKSRKPVKDEDKAYAAQLDKRIVEIQKKIAAKELEPKPKKQTVDTKEVAERRANLAALNKELSDLRKASKPTKTPEQIALQSLKTRLKNRTAQLQDKIARGDFETTKRKSIVLDEEANKLQAAADLAKEEWQTKRAMAQYKNSSVFQKVKHTALNAYDAARMLMTTGEFSFVLRQGKLATLSHPILASKALGSALKALVRSKEDTMALDLAIHNHPDAPAARQAKLHLLEPGQSLNKQEEFMMGRWADSVPLVNRFNRAAEVFLNKLRFDVWNSMRKSMSKSGTPTPEEERQIAIFVNESTGRGTLGESGERAAVLLSRLMFSPRYFASRIQLLAGHSLWGGTGRSRRIIAGEYAKSLIGLALYYSLLSMAFKALKGTDDEEKEIELDTRSSDFGKIRIGDTRLDPLAGLSQVIVFGSRTGATALEAAGVQVKATKDSKGKLRYLHQAPGMKIEFGKDKWTDTAARFARSKAHPIPGSVANLFDGTDLSGSEANVENQATNLIAPITYTDIYKALKEQGLETGTALALLAFLGEGIQTYKSK